MSMPLPLPSFVLLLLWCIPVSTATLGPLVSTPAFYHLRLTTIEGMASYYHHSLEGRPMANGSRYRATRMTAASPTLTLNRTAVVCRQDRPLVCCSVLLTDRGPFVAGRVIDLSWAAAKKLCMLRSGIINVIIRVVPQ